MECGGIDAAFPSIAVLAYGGWHWQALLMRKQDKGLPVIFR